MRKLKIVLTFLIAVMVGAVVPFLLLWEKVYIPPSEQAGAQIAFCLLLGNGIVVWIVRRFGRKISDKAYVRAILIPVLLWMIVSVGGIMYLGRLGEMTKTYAMYHICEKTDDRDFCLCKVNYVYKNLPYLFDTNNQYDAVVVINEHRADLDFGIRECQQKFHITTGIKTIEEE